MKSIKFVLGNSYYESSQGGEVGYFIFFAEKGMERIGSFSKYQRTGFYLESVIHESCKYLGSKSDQFDLGNLEHIGFDFEEVNKKIDDFRDGLSSIEIELLDSTSKQYFDELNLFEKRRAAQIEAEMYREAKKRGNI